MGFADSNPSLGQSPWGAAQAMRRGGIRDERQIAEALLGMPGADPEEIAQITGLDPSEFADSAGMDPGIDTNAPDSFGGMPADDPEDTFGVMRDDEGNEPGPFDPDIGLEDQEPVHPPMSVEEGIDQQVDPMGAQAQALADSVVPTASPAVSVLEGGAGKKLAEEIARQKAAVPDAPPPEADPARIASLLTGGASGDTSFDKASTENPDPGILDTIKGAGGKLKTLLSALAPSDAAAQGLMATGFGMMGAQGTYGSTMGAIGQGGAAGMKTYQTAKRREDIAQAKADQLKSLEKRADATIQIKREELAGKTKAQVSKDADAKEKRMAAKLTQLRMLAAQGNTAEARDIFSRDPELQEYLHRKDLAFDRGSSWIKGGSGNDGPKSMGAWAAEIYGKLRRGENVLPQDVAILKSEMKDDATRTAFTEMTRMMDTMEGRMAFMNMSREELAQYLQTRADALRDAESSALDKTLHLGGGDGGGAPPPLPAAGAKPGGGMSTKEYLERLRKGPTGGN